MNLDTLKALFTAALKPRRSRSYMLQHAHCGHVALISSDRRKVWALHQRATRAHLWSWRVRLMQPGLDQKTSCTKCKKDLKVLRPKRGATAASLRGGRA